MRSHHHESPTRLLQIFLLSLCQLCWSGRTHLLQGSETTSIHHSLALSLCHLCRRTRNQFTQSANALHNSLCHHILRQWRCHQVLDAGCACTLAKYHDIVWITAKLSNVIVHPLQSSYLVVGAIVARRAITLSRQQRMRQEAHESETIVDSHQNHTSLCPSITVHGNLMSPTSRIGTTMYPHGHRQFGVGITQCASRCPHIQIETVFTELRIATEIKLLCVELSCPVCSLKGSSAERIHHLHTFPSNYRLWLLPTQVAHRRSSIGDAFINHHLSRVSQHTLNLSAFYGKYRIHIFRLLCATSREQGSRHCHNQISCFHLLFHFKIYAANLHFFTDSLKENGHLLNKIANLSLLIVSL